MHAESPPEEGALVSAPKNATQSADANNDPSNALSNSEVLMASSVTVQTSEQQAIMTAKNVTYLGDTTSAALGNSATSPGTHSLENSATPSTINALVNATTAGGATGSLSTSSVRANSSESNTQKIDNETTLPSFTPTISIQAPLNASFSYQMNASAATSTISSSTVDKYYFQHHPQRNLIRF